MSKIPQNLRAQIYQGGGKRRSNCHLAGMDSNLAGMTWSYLPNLTGTQFPILLLLSSQLFNKILLIGWKTKD